MQLPQVVCPLFYRQSDHSNLYLKGVTHATIENWEYMEIIRKAADPKCSSHLENAISSIDSILAIPRMSTVFKGLFGLASLQHNEDFASVLEVGSLIYLYHSCTMTTYANCAFLVNRVL